MSRIIIFGASGLLGASLVRALRGVGHEVLAQGRQEGSACQVDPYDSVSVSQLLAEHRPDSIVNLIAATNVDQCELNPELAWQANAEVVRVITSSIAAQGAASASRPHLIQVSTDQVYSGPGPHPEEHLHPINVYGLSKYTGEILAGYSGATVLRTNFFGRSHCDGRISFSDWLVSSLRERKQITVFEDMMFSALHIDTLCRIITRCIELRPAGTYNAGCRNAISKAGFAFALAQALALPTDMVKVGVIADVALKARRPVDMSLQVGRLEAALGLVCPQMQEEIEHTAKEYLND